MKPLIPYLTFDSNCREAMKFYETCFGGKLEMMTSTDAPKTHALAVYKWQNHYAAC